MHLGFYMQVTQSACTIDVCSYNEFDTLQSVSASTEINYCNYLEVIIVFAVLACCYMYVAAN